MANRRLRIGGGGGKRKKTDGEKAHTRARTRINKIHRITKELKIAGGMQVEKLEERLSYWESQRI